MDIEVDSPHNGSPLPDSMTMQDIQHQQHAGALRHQQNPLGLHNNQHIEHSQQPPLQHMMNGVGHPQVMGIYSPPHEAEERPRGRDRSRDGVSDGLDASGMSVLGGQLSSNLETTSRKRRRSRKGLDKKFECPHPGCGKSYSRAEHLYRHQLNHAPKKIYYCDFPDCKRSFVRQDLCTRHRERHTNRGSQLQRKDNFLNNPMSAVVMKNGLQERKNSFNKDFSSPESTSTSAMTVKSEEESPILSPNGSRCTPGLNMTASPVLSTSTATLARSSSVSTSNFAMTENRAKIRRTTADSSSAQRRANECKDEAAAMRRFSADHVISKSATSPIDRNQLFNGGNQQTQAIHANKNGFTRPTLQTSISTPNLHNLSLQSPYSAHTVNSGPMSVPSATTTPNSVSDPFTPGFQPFSLPQPAYSIMTPTSGSGVAPNGYMTSPSTSSSQMDGASSAAAAVSSSGVDFDPMAYTIPVFGSDGYSRSPNWLANDFACWFFDDPSMNGQSQGPSRSPTLSNNFIDNSNIYAVGPDFPGAHFYTTMHHPMAVTSLIAPPSPPQESLLSEHKRQELVDIIEAFPEMTGTASGHSLTTAAMEDENHALSLTMMQSYISLYWTHFHNQLPILHRPTFSADKTPNLLLLTILTIGASCVDSRQDPAMASSAADLAGIMAWNLRWQIFANADFRPPAKLWVFQALLLLETFEKMYSTRQLHERAHIHHATTLTLMRRGSSLTGRCAYDSPQCGRDGKSGNDNGPFTGQPSGANTTDEGWNRWIISEATRRAAFAAFVLDSTHATMFGHSAVMVAHEMRLQLPCDEALWEATSGAEVIRIEQPLIQAGVKPTTFLEGLKRTLNGQSVRTNSFGRTVLMAGLLSVSWHMHQRDLQVTSLGVIAQLGGKDKWRQALTRSFDHWKKDFDTSLRRIRPGGATTYDGVEYLFPPTEDVEHENIFESRTVLHHLAHMSMHVDIVDLQIFAGARRLLGRTIVPQDTENARKRMKEWAPTAKARDAAFYALRFLSQVLLIEERVDMQFSIDDDDSGIPCPRRLSGATTGVPAYSAREDHLLNRPWVLYYAALVVWSYGYALEGSLVAPVRTLSTPTQKYTGMRAYLTRVGGVRAPDDLAKICSKNECLGLLLTLKEMFANTNWELLIEASRLLGNCIGILTGEIAA
ncbi:hypothetical protein RUND412_009446 [Rhizina undulata]